MKVESIVLGSIGTNCYIVTNEETKECFAVDMAECPQEYVNYIKNNGLEMKALFLSPIKTYTKTSDQAIPF